MKSYYYLLLTCCLALQLNATYKDLLLKNQQLKEYIDINTIVIQEKEPITTVTLGLKKITTIKSSEKKSSTKTSLQAKEAQAQKAKIAKAQSIERVKEWVESRKDHPLFKGNQPYRHSSSAL